MTPALRAELLNERFRAIGRALEHTCETQHTHAEAQNVREWLRDIPDCSTPLTMTLPGTKKAPPEPVGVSPISKQALARRSGGELLSGSGSVLVADQDRTCGRSGVGLRAEAVGDVEHQRDVRGYGGEKAIVEKQVGHRRRPVRCLRCTMYDAVQHVLAYQIP